MGTVMSGCQGKPQIEIREKLCPNCGEPIEIFSVDTQMTCEKCGFVIYNDTLNCVRWCKHARRCVGESMYDHMMKIAERQKADPENPHQKPEHTANAASVRSSR